MRHDLAMAFSKQVKYFDEWFRESAAAIAHNGDDWVTAHEMVEDFAQLGFTASGTPISDLDSDERREFRRVLQRVLYMFVRGKILRAQPKAVYTDNQGFRLNDEASYQLSNLGQKILAANPIWRFLYIGTAYFLLRSERFIKRYKWVLGIITVVGTTLRAFEIIQSTYIAIAAAIVVLMLTIVAKRLFELLN